jgi:hypothetical protein
MALTQARTHPSPKVHRREFLCLAPSAALISSISLEITPPRPSPNPISISDGLIALWGLIWITLDAQPARREASSASRMRGQGFPSSSPNGGGQQGGDRYAIGLGRAHSRNTEPDR